MATQSYTVYVVDRDGLEVAYVAANAGTIAGSEGNQFVNSGREVLHIKNGHTAQVTVTIITPGIVDVDLEVPDRTIDIDDGDEIFCGPWPVINYGNPLQFQFDVVTNITCGVFRLPA